MDFLYILGDGSQVKNEELRFSFRTIARFVKDLGRVIVVGEDPGFLSDEVEYYPVAEADGNKEYRIAQKIMYACEEEIVTGDFVFINDDHFICKPITAKNYPYYHRGTLFTEAPDKYYQKSLHNTGKYLETLRKSTFHYDIHTPIIYNAEKFMALAPHFAESKKLERGLVVKSLYSNMYGVKGIKHHDAKLHRLRTPEDFAKIENTNCFSCSDAGWRNGVGNYLVGEFNEPSIYEL